MRRQGQYADSGVNSYVPSQMQHMSAQRMHHSSGLNHFPGRSDTLPSEEERPYISSKVEGQWQWDRDGTKGSNPMSSHIFSEGQGGDASRSFYQGQRLDSKMGSEKRTNKDPRAQLHEQDMEIGNEDNPLSQTFEGLEQKFHDEIMKLINEQHDAEDTENARHREKIGEINVKYQEKLAALRVQHAGHRDDFLRRESQARMHQYQQAGMHQYQNTTGPSEPHGYGGATAAAAEAMGEAGRAYAASQFDSYRERAEYLERSRNHAFESRGPFPGGRAYNNNARFY